MTRLLSLLATLALSLSALAAAPYLSTGSGPLAVGTGAINTGAAAYFVATTGNDSNAGTLAAPFLTLTKAQNAMQFSGIKTTYVRAGTYSSTALVLTVSDNGETWSYYPPDGYNTAILDGGASSSTTGGNTITIDGGSNVTINGFTIQNFQQWGVGIHGGISDGPAGFTNNVASTSGNTISNNIINTGYTSLTNMDAGGGVWADGFNTNLTIANNVITNQYGCGIRVVPLSDALNSTNETYTFSGLTIKNNAIFLVNLYAGDSGAIYMEDQMQITINVTVMNNFIRDYQENPSTQKNSTSLPRDVAVYLDSGTSNITITGNVIAATSNTNLLTGTIGGTNAWFMGGGFNNTFSGNIIDEGTSALYAPVGYDDQYSDATGNIIERNIWIGNWAGSQASSYYGTGPAAYFYDSNYGTSSHFPTVTNNLYYNYGGGNILSTSNQPHGADAAPVTGTNPSFASGYLYALNGGSPAFSSPLNFPGITGGWGPPGYSIPSGTAPSY